jgi:hypothetical protein
VDGADVLGRPLHRPPEAGVDLVERRAPLGARHLELLELGAVELAGHRDERRVAVAPHAGDDGRRARAHRVVARVVGHALAQGAALLAREPVDAPGEAQRQPLGAVARARVGGERHARLGRRRAQIVGHRRRDELAARGLGRARLGRVGRVAFVRHAAARRAARRAVVGRRRAASRPPGPAPGPRHGISARCASRGSPRRPPP